ncbi:MAG: VanZ family protein [Maioricimonas sp. JB049]
MIGLPAARLSTTRWRTTARIASIAYAALLGGLLLTMDPFELVGASGTSLQIASKMTPISMLQHLTVYACFLPLLYAAAWQKHAPLKSAVAIALSHGMIFEWLQQFVPGRYADWYDVLANAGGVAIGALAVTIFIGSAATDQVDRRPAGDT